MNWKKYSKAIVSLLATIIATGVVIQQGGDPESIGDMATPLVSLLGTIAVFWARNKGN